MGIVRTKWRDELIAVFRETTAVAWANGVPVDVEAVIGPFDRVPGIMQSSMQRDFIVGRPVEIEAIGETILRAAVLANVEVPVTMRLVEELRNKLKGRSSQ